nr:major piroplasma surface protein [Theileria orientalis]
MLSKRSFNLLAGGFFLICSAAAEEKKDPAGAEEKRDFALEVSPPQGEYFTVSAPNASRVVFTASGEYRLKSHKGRDNPVYPGDTSILSPLVAHRIKHGDALFFNLACSHAKPLLFKKKTAKDGVQFNIPQSLGEFVWKEKKELKALESSKFPEAVLFAVDPLVPGKVYDFLGPSKSKSFNFEKSVVWDAKKAKYPAVKVYVGSDEKKVVRLEYFYTADERFKEVYFKLVDGKWKKLEQSEANKDLHAMNNAWPLDYKPLVVKFSPLAALSAVLIASLAVFFYL